MNGKVLSAAALICALVTPAGAETAPSRQIVVTGEGRVDTTPDMAVISLGVTHEAKAAMAAMGETSAAVAAVLERLTAMGVAEKDVQTENVSLNPIWSDPGSQGGVPSISGFSASNTVQVRVRDLERLGAIMDTAIGDGANTFSGLQFSLQNPAPQEEEARKRAVADGMARAKALAEAAGVTLGPVQQINEIGGGIPGPMKMSMARDEGIPIAAGEVSVSVTVSMTFAIE